MVKKLQLVTAQPQPDSGGVPPDLGAYGKRLWDAVQSSYRIEDIGGVELLRQACAAADRAQDCAARIAREGMTVRTKAGGPREHPLLRAELQNRAFVTRCLVRLGITEEPLKPIGRPPKLYGDGMED